MKIETATLGTGCFWCTEAIYKLLKGVQSVKSGYAGGAVSNPTYEQVCSGSTGHAECVQIEFDADLITFEALLEIFWNIHDPTSLNRQGEDVGTQYRSVIFYHNESQKQIAEEYIKQLTSANHFPKPIVTTLEAMNIFYAAENYHQDYFALKGNENPYCQVVVRPKVEKFRDKYNQKIR